MLNWTQLIQPGLIVAGGVLGTALAPPIAVTVLGAAGFGSAGVGAGTLAAAIQSTGYGGAIGAGTAFSMAQSLAMGGAMATSFMSIFGGGAGLAAGAAAAAYTEGNGEEGAGCERDGDGSANEPDKSTSNQADGTGETRGEL